MDGNQLNLIIDFLDNVYRNVYNSTNLQLQEADNLTHNIEQLSEKFFHDICTIQHLLILSILNLKHSLLQICLIPFL